jgi:hypothetical protein
MRRVVLLALGVLALAFTVPAAANPPTEDVVVDVFEDVNPCTGEVHTVTIVNRVSFHEHDGRFVGQIDATITTDPTGFVGHGTNTFVFTEHVDMFRLTHILTSPSGDRIQARFVFVADPETGTVRVEKGGPTCLGP